MSSPFGRVFFLRNPLNGFVRFNFFGSSAEFVGVSGAVGGNGGMVLGRLKALRFAPTRYAGAFGGLDPTSASRPVCKGATADGCSAGGSGTGWGRGPTLTV